MTLGGECLDLVSSCVPHFPLPYWQFAQFSPGLDVPFAKGSSIVLTFLECGEAE